MLVLGMHRSGTSALARVLNLLGCDLPKTLMEATEHNEAGHWESVEIMNLNNRILRSAGSNWYDWLEFNPGWYASPKTEEYKERALEVLNQEFGKSRLFVLKDPRICRIVPFWLDVLDTAGIKPVIISQVRNPLEVAESLSKRSNIDPALGHLLWLSHVLDAEVSTRGLQRFQVSYDRLLSDWPRLISEMQDALQVSWPRMSTLANDDIEKFLTEKLRHHEQKTESVTGNPFLSAWLRDTFSIFSRWAEKGENSDDFAELDRIRVELNAAAPAFARLTLLGHQRANEIKSAQGQLEEQKQKLEEIEAEHRALAEKSASLESELTTELAQRNSELEGVQDELKKIQSALAQRTAEADAANAQLHEAASDVEALKAELSHTQSALAQRSAEADEVTAQLQTTKDAQRESAELAERLSGELEAERTRAISELENLRSAKDRVEQRLADRFDEIAALTRLLSDKEVELASKANKLGIREQELTEKKRQLKATEKASRLSEEQVNVLREVSTILLNGSESRSLIGRLSALMPGSVRLQKQMKRLKSQGIFDPDAYLAANPDVAKAGHDPLWHYLNFGIAEKRKLSLEQDEKSQ